jgi:hypothetical protein
VQDEIDRRVKAMFAGLTVTLPTDAAAAGAAADAQQQEQQQQQTYTFPDLDDAAFAALGRDQPRVLLALLDAAQAADKAAWTGFQSDIQTLKLQRQRLSGQLADARSLLDVAQREAAKAQGLGRVADKAELLAGGSAAAAAPLLPGGKAVRPVRIVLVCGFESFNVGEQGLWAQVVFQELNCLCDGGGGRLASAAARWVVRCEEGWRREWLAFVPLC